MLRTLKMGDILGGRNAFPHLCRAGGKSYLAGIATIATRALGSYLRELPARPVTRLP